MSDNQMTELLPCPFCGGEASIEKYWNGDHESLGFFVWCHGNDCVVEPVTGAFREEEAAIGAWNSRAELVSKPPYDKLLHCLENDWHISASWDGLRKFWCIELTDEGVRLRDAMHGTLTAEQVREAIERNFTKVAVLDDGKPVEWRDDWVCKVGIDYRAIADELNTRTERTCRVKASYYTADVDSRNSSAEWYFAFSCGHELYWDDAEPPKYCPECGRKVVDG